MPWLDHGIHSKPLAIRTPAAPKSPICYCWKLRLVERLLRPGNGGGRTPHERFSCLPMLTTGDWLLVLAVLAFVAFNFFLWALPLTQIQLFLISLPLGIAQQVAFLRYVMRA